MSLSFIINLFRLKLRIKPLLAKKFGARKFYKPKLVVLVLEESGLIDTLNNEAIACFCGEKEYLKYAGLKPKNSDYRYIREKYNFKTIKRDNKNEIDFDKLL